MSFTSSDSSESEDSRLAAKVENMEEKEWLVKMRALEGRRHRLIGSREEKDGLHFKIKKKKKKLTFANFIISIMDKY